MKREITITTLLTALIFAVALIVVGIIGYALFNGHGIVGAALAVTVFFITRHFVRKLNK